VDRLDDIGRIRGGAHIGEPARGEEALAADDKVVGVWGQGGQERVLEARDYLQQQNPLRFDVIAGFSSTSARPTRSYRNKSGGWRVTSRPNPALQKVVGHDSYPGLTAHRWLAAGETAHLPARLRQFY
jgi:hypothetical protein